MAITNYYAVDYYELIGALPTDSRAKLRIKILKLWGELDVEIRTKIPQRIKGEAKEALKKKLGRNPTEYEERDYVYEKTEDPDPSKRDREHNEKNRKLALVSAAKDVLLSEGEVKKDSYDKTYGRRATCFDHHVIGGGIYWFNIDGFGVRKLNSCYFCSQHCFDTYIKLNAPRKKGPNKDNVPCRICHKGQAFGWRKRKNGDLYCEDCYNAVPNCSWCKIKKVWDNNYSSEGKRFCSQKCFDKWSSEKNKSKGSSQPRTKPQYLTALTSLPGWELLTEDEKDKFKGMVLRSNFESDWRKAITEAQKLISTKGYQNPPDEPDEPDEGDEGDDNENKNLQSEIQKAIQEILNELNKEPKLTLKNEEWKTWLENCSSLEELNQQKQEFLDQIKTLRQKQGGGNSNLTELQFHTIHLIKQELNKNPPVSADELTDSNWEEKINQASNEDEINDIKNRVLANVIDIRAAKGQKNRLNELILQAQQPENWNNFQNLENIIKQIKKLSSSNAYREKAAEVQALEKKLQELDPSQYQKTSQDLLEQQVKDNGLNDSNMDDETKKAVAEAKQDPTNLVKKAKAEEKINQNGADNNLKNLTTEISNKLKKGNLTKKEKQEAINKILKFIITENKYQQSAYQKLKPKVDALLAELQGNEKNTQENPPVPWPKILGISTLIALPLIIIILIALRARRRRLNRGRFN